MLRSTLSFSLTALLLLFSASALGEAPQGELERLDRDIPAEQETVTVHYEAFRLPQPTMIEVEIDGKPTPYAGYDFETFQQLLLMDVALRESSLIIPSLKAENKELRLASEEMALALGDANKQIQALRDDRERLTEKWKEDNEARHVAENKPRFGSAAPWIISGTLLGVVAILTAVIAGGG